MDLPLVADFCAGVGGRALESEPLKSERPASRSARVKEEVISHAYGQPDGRASHTALKWLRNRLRQRRTKEQQWRAQVRAMNVDNVNRLASVSDAELIAAAPGIPSQTHQMEMSRRLKAAIMDLTVETIASRKSSERAARRLVWLTVFVMLLTAVLVALTVVLAVRS